MNKEGKQRRQGSEARQALSERQGEGRKRGGELGNAKRASGRVVGSASEAGGKRPAEAARRQAPGRRLGQPKPEQSSERGGRARVTSPFRLRVST